ncbi:MAG: hypothetical protein K8W52_04765 [Deltaproteobacteria bacterium]|nr:hypothetical protein [Deltaproteobacteria bacterium]
MTPPPPVPRWQQWAVAHAPQLVLAVFTLALGFAFIGVFQGEIAGDDLTFHFAEATRLRDCLAHHDWDLWNPSANLGFASGYYYQMIPQLAPAAGSWLLGGSVLFWFQFFNWLPLVLAPAASYRGLRLMGATPWQAVAGAIAVSLCMSSSKWGHGTDGNFSVGLYTQTWALAAFGLALGHGARWIDTGKGLGGAAVWGTFVGLCHPFAGIALGVALGAGEIGRIVARWIAPPIGYALRLTWAAVSGGDEPADRPRPHDPVKAVPAFGRLVILGAFLLVGSASAWLPVVADYVGFGGFPHRVEGEDGTGFGGLFKWISTGELLDTGVGRMPILTILVLVAAMLFRPGWTSRLWAAAIAYGVFLAVGPHLKTQDDLFPAIRFLGSLQIVLALIAGGAFASMIVEGLRRVAKWRAADDARLALMTVALLLGVGVVGAGLGNQGGRVHVATEFETFYRDELDDIFPAIHAATAGREQARAGAEAHWSNLLPFAYEGRSSMLQMGGAGLQASPNYVYLWEQQDPSRSAWIYDAPLVLLKHDQADNVPGGVILAETKHYMLKELPAPGLVSPVQVMGELPEGRKPARAAVIRWLKGDQPMKEQVLAYHGSGIAGPVPQGMVVAYSRQPSPGDEPDITADVKASAPTTFMFRESWHPRWVAFVDGAPAPIRRVTPDVIAVDVTPGDHHIALRFDRPWWAWATWLLWPLVGLLGWFGVAGWQRLRGKATPAT